MRSTIRTHRKSYPRRTTDTSEATNRREAPEPRCHGVLDAPARSTTLTLTNDFSGKQRELNPEAL
eukprot:8188965-Pyramimonas_sp.AAC.1